MKQEANGKNKSFDNKNKDIYELLKEIHKRDKVDKEFEIKTNDVNEDDLIN